MAFVAKIRTSVVLELTHDEMHTITSALAYIAGAKVKVDPAACANLNRLLLENRVKFEEQLHKQTVTALQRATELDQLSEGVADAEDPHRNE